MRIPASALRLVTIVSIVQWSLPLDVLIFLATRLTIVLHQMDLRLVWNCALSVGRIITDRQTNFFASRKAHLMKRIFALMVVIAAVGMFDDSTAQAQNFQSGFEFGSGLNASGFNLNSPRGFGNRFNNFNNGFLGMQRREELPYFAAFPPVYYSHIVKRPYGVSPFAAPSGIMPVEMTILPPVTKRNPYFESPVAPVSDQSQPAVDDTKNKATWVSNPHLNRAFAFSGK